VPSPPPPPTPSRSTMEGTASSRMPSTPKVQQKRITRITAWRTALLSKFRSG